MGHVGEIPEPVTAAEPSPDEASSQVIGILHRQTKATSNWPDCSWTNIRASFASHKLALCMSKLGRVDKVWGPFADCGEVEEAGEG